MKFMVSEQASLHRRCWCVYLLAAAAALCVRPATAASLKELCEVQGARGNAVLGLGFVVGLAGTGDSAKSTISAQERTLERLGFDVRDINELAAKNSAMVTVTATIPAFAKEGTRIDVHVASLSDAQSLEGGTLLMTQLKFPGQESVYAMAQGPVSVGGFSADASGGATSVRNNHVTAGRIPMGAYVENEIPSTITDGERVILLLKKPGFDTAHAVQQGINGKYGAGTALAMGAGAVRVTVPETGRANLVSFIAQLQDIIVATKTPARVVFNERTGTIVMGGAVTIKPSYVAHGSLTIRIATTPVVTPALSFTDAGTTVTELADVDVEEVEAVLLPVEGTTAGEVAQALNKLRVTPRDMISIFQLLREGGFMEADLEIM